MNGVICHRYDIPKSDLCLVDKEKRSRTYHNCVGCPYMEVV